ncbi:hypothetical protein CIB48_g11779 [Xylaria polymorpha]|nr:hypothetical protein CIB48_g11779 [Xylaria polymorpha]
MPVPTIMGRPLRLVPRNILKASKQGLYIPRRQLSIFDRLIKLVQKPSGPSETSEKDTPSGKDTASGKDGQPPRQPSQFDQFLKPNQQPSEPWPSSTPSGKDRPLLRQTSQFDAFLSLGEIPSAPSSKKKRKRSRKTSQLDQLLEQGPQSSIPSTPAASAEDKQRPRQPSQLDEFLDLDQELLDLSAPFGIHDQPLSTPNDFKKSSQRFEKTDGSYRTTDFRTSAKFSPTGKKPKKHDHYWQSDLQINNCRISYYKNVSAEPLVLSRAFLRDACTCEKCVDPSSGQKNFASADVPLLLDIKNLTITEGGELLVCWKNDFHTGGLHYSQYPPSLWDRAESVPIELIPEPRLWNRERMIEWAPYFRHKSFMVDGVEYRRAMTAFSYFGLLFLRDVPWSEESIKDIASRLGVIQDTFYGTTWDVKSKPNAENVAYTNAYLGLHQDLLYMGNVPRVQILHCLQNTCAGGESIFSDVYHYNKNGHIYRSERPVLSDLGSSRLGVYWSPPFQSPVQMDEPTLESMAKYKEWHKASRRMKEILEDHEAVFEYKMKPDECVIFDNRRVFHGRRAFDTSSGERWLKGTYVENDSFNSKMRSLKLVSDPISIIHKLAR